MTIGSIITGLFVGLMCFGAAVILSCVILAVYIGLVTLLGIQTGVL